METTCSHCRKSYSRGRNTIGLYCSNQCQMNAVSARIVANWQAGIDPGYAGRTIQLKAAVRRHILAKSNYACVKCGWAERHPIDGRPLVQVDHMDGNAKNCAENNLQVVCPNCHSMTINYGARNKNSARDRTAYNLPGSTSGRPRSKDEIPN